MRAKGTKARKKLDTVPSACSRALAIPEVLGMTFAFSETASLAVSSSVSIFWSEVALPYLWETLDDVVPLLELLSPMKSQLIQDRAGSYANLWQYVDESASFKWDRFRHYAPLVKKLTISETRPTQNVIAESVLTSILFTQPLGTLLLPNIRHLICSLSDRPNLQSILPFVSPNLIELELSLARTTPSKDVSKLLQSLTDRTPIMKRLKLRTACPAMGVNQTLAEWIGGAPKLTTITVPRFYHTAEIVAALAKLEDLEGIHSDYSVAQEPTEDGSHFEVVAGFPKLREVAWDMAPVRAAKLLPRAPYLSFLTYLTLSWHRQLQRKELAKFTAIFSTVCSKATGLSLNLFTENQDATFPLEFSDIRPLFRCNGLKSLEVAHDYPFTLTASDAEKLGKAWPGLEALSLCYDPYQNMVTAESGTQMEVLSSLAKHCPKLEEIGLFFNSTVPPKFNGDLQPSAEFSCLQELHVGTSKVPGSDRAAVGFFLGSLCRLKLEIDTYETIWHFDGEEPNDEDSSGDWAAVADIAENAVLCKSKIRQGVGREERC